jgi:DnaJ-class molecular chaperone
MIATPVDRRKHYAALGLSIDDPHSVEEVNAAYREVVSKAHPDKGGSADDAAETIKVAKAAREFILRNLNNFPALKPVECNRCAGRGRLLRGAFHCIECPKCEGEGVTYETAV